jgi:hypothetical protein
MALRGDRFEDATDITFFMNVTAERGLLVIHDTSGSGSALDQSDAVVAVPTGQAVSSTKPAGLLMNDVVNLDLTRQHLNEHKDEVQVNSKVRLLRRGWAVTDKISGTPNAGDSAFYTNTGLLTPSDPGSGAKVGRFLSKKDNDGFAKVEINITG